MSRKLVAANWKMHFTVGQASLFLHKLQEQVPKYQNIDVVLCPNFLALQTLSLQVDSNKFKLGAQNCYHQDEGAFTGETSAAMLRDLVQYVILGHSERRRNFGEGDSEIAKKVQAALRNGLRVILCVGETKQEHADGETYDVLYGQVTAGLSNTTSAEIDRIVIAYEPPWAISTSKDARHAPVEGAVKAIKHIRKQIDAMFGSKAAQDIRVLYGGSVDSRFASGYLKGEGVDGLLVGGASLNAAEFSAIIEAAHASLQPPRKAM